MSSTSGLYAPQAYANTTTPYYKPYNADSGSNWSRYPAVSNVSLAGYDITSNAALDIQASGSIEISTTAVASRIEIAASQNILLIPNSFSGSSAGGINIQDGIITPVIAGVEAYDIIPNTPGGIIRSQTMPVFQARSGPSALILQASDIGKSIYLTGSPIPSIQLPYNEGAPVLPNGAKYTLYIEYSVGATLPEGAGYGIQLYRGNPGTGEFIGNIILTENELAKVELFSPNNGVAWAIFQTDSGVYSL